ncbi:DUF4240 domain-containing protein [Archangium violaceum]|uniref:DUF4240 domain-containing protein n=1 Tax=Archangium violaceum TaxID=83451 RepID=UPI0037BEAE91
MSQDDIAPWFWEVIERCKPSLATLSEWLESAKREDVENFQRFYLDAATCVAEAWNGPVVDGIEFSEDSTEDFTAWVVSQGRSVWQQAVDSSANQEALVREYWRVSEGEPSAYVAWSTEGVRGEYAGYLAPEAIAHAVYERRFGEDLLDVLAG